MRRTAPILFALVLALPALAADVAFDQTLPVGPDGELEIELIVGEITVIGSDRNDVHVTGTYDDEYFDLDVDVDDGNVSIELEPEEDVEMKHSEPPVLEIRVPRGISLDYESISGQLRVDGVEGFIDIETVSGAVEISGVDLEIDVEAVSGSVDIVASGVLRNGDFEVVSGNVDVTAALAPDGQYSFEAISGEVVLRLPASTSAEFNLETFSGEIENEHGPAAKATSPYLPSKELQFTLGAGGAEVDVETMNGTIRLLRR